MNLPKAVQVRIRAARVHADQRRTAARLRRAGHDVAASVRLPADLDASVPSARIGEGTGINAGCVLKGAGPVEIGRYCAIGEQVTIITSGHRTTGPSVQLGLAERYGFASGVVDASGVSVGNDVWLGDGVIVLPGVSIGDGAVCGAGAVIAADVDPYVVVGGVPAKPIRARFDADVRGFLIETAWWDWSPERIRRNRAFFDADLTQLNAEELRSLLVA